MPELLTDAPHPDFIRFVLAKHPAPKSPLTGLPAWEGGGIRLHGSQWEIVSEPFRFQQCGAGWRYGKSFVGAVKIYIDSLWRSLHSPQKRDDDLYWVIGPDYEQAQPEMEHLHRLFEEGGIIHKFHTPDGQSWSITFPDTKQVIETKTGREAMKIAGKAPRGIIMAEGAQHNYEIWVNSRGRVMEQRGWVFMSGTFEDALPWYFQKAEDWAKATAEGKFYSGPSWDNTVIYPAGRDDPEILAIETGGDMSPDLFQMKIAGKPSRPQNLVIPQATEQYHVAHRYPHLRSSYEPEERVYLFADPGTAHAYAVFAVQMFGNIAWVIDAVYRWGRTVSEVVEECATREWAKNVETVVMDFAGRQRRSEGPSNLEQWHALWLDLVKQPIYVIANPVPLHAGYEQHRRALLNSWPEEDAQRVFNADRQLRTVTNPDGPRLMFDPRAAAPMFGGSVDGRAYRGEYHLHRYPKRRDGQTHPGEDPIDADNDGVKAVNYGLVYLFNAAGARQGMWIGQSYDWELSA